MSYRIPDIYLGGKGEELIDEDVRNMNYALNASTASLDPSTKVGACIVSSKGELLSIGYNKPSWDPDKFPWGSNVKELGLENTKYPFIHHAEQVAINNYKGNRSDLVGSTMYVTLYPCPACANAIALAGIKKIVYLNNRLTEEIDISEMIMNYNEIEHIDLKEKICVEKIEFNYKENEKNNIKVLRLKKNDSN